MASNSSKYFGSTQVQKEKVDKAQKIAREIYDSLKLNNKEVLRETLNQIVYCVQFNRCPNKEQINEMLMCKTELQVERKAHSYKYASRPSVQKAS